MALFTPLGLGDLDEISGKFGLGEVRAAEPLWAGTINSNFRLVTGRGTIFARVNEGKGEADVAYEAALVDALAARGVPTPRPLAAADGRRFAAVRAGLVTLFPWVDGAHRTEATIAPRDTHALGVALARLHLAAADQPARAGRYTVDQLTVRWVTVLQDERFTDEHARLVVAEELHPLPDLPGGIIHQDLFPDNVLWTAGGLELLDFEQAATGAWMYDVAVCACSWCWHGGAFLPARVEALRAGYASVRAPSAVEREAFPACLRLAAARFTVTRVTDVELDPRASDEIRAAKSYRAFLARLDALRATTAWSVWS